MGNDKCFFCDNTGKLRELGTSEVKATAVLCTCHAFDMEILSADAEREPNAPMTIEDEVSVCINSMQVF